MKEKTRKIFIMIVMAALIVSLMAASFAALTYGRYSGGKYDENSPYDDYIDFVGATAYEVRTPEQFVNAINNGYSYIKIAADAEEPFVVNNDIANVYTNLVIDVNGKTVIRNSRNPVLDVRRSISVVLVYDSSVEGSGGFYNPVGSALQTSGGSLTVGAGVYESGPSDAADATLPSSKAVSLVTRENRTSTSYNAAQSGVSLPILTKSGGDKTKSGDKYLPENWTDTVSGDQINPDTYLLYTEVQNAFVGKGETSGDATFKSGQLYINCEKFTVEGDTETTTYSADAFNPVCNVASCDFYYYYPVEGTPGTTSQPQTYAVVYGYNDVNSLAKTEDTGLTEYQGGTQLVWPYAAIRSVRDGAVGGVTHARGGAFTTNFGTDNTYGILSVGGEMTVGTESATAPPTFTAVGEGTCIGMSAQTGDTLTIASGTFSSEVGDTILMRGGEMTVTGGTFTKSGNKARPSGGLEAIEASRTALIHMLGGELTIDGTVTGESDSRTYSVNMTAGSTDAPLTNVFGIYSTETTDETTGKAVEGTVSVSGCSIAVNGTYSAGVLSSAGTVNLGGKAAGKAETNITVNNSISNNLLTSSAVSSEGGTINLNNTVNITSDSLGITARGTINVNGGTTSVDTDNATGVYVNNGSLTVNSGAKLEVTSTISQGCTWVTPPGTSEPTNAPNIYNGVYVQNGSLDSSGGTLNVDFTGVVSDAISPNGGDNMGLTEQNAYREFKVKSYAVRVEGDAAGDDTEVIITAGTIINQVHYNEQGKEIAGGGGGVLVNGGTVTLGAAVTDNDGTVTRSGPTVSANGTGYQVNTNWWGTSTVEYDCEDKGNEWSYTPPTTGGDAVKIVDGTLTVDGGKYTAAYGNGILVSNGTATVNGGTFTGTDNRRYGTGLYTGAGSNYGLKVLGGSATVKGGSFTANGGGVFIMGENASTPQTQIISANINVSGATGVSVWNYANVVFGGTESTGLTITAESTGLAVEITTANLGNSAKQKITINSGTFQSTGTVDNKNGIWYGNAGATLTINGGEFKGSGSGGLGLKIDANPGTSIQISSGTFIGGADNDDDNTQYGGGGAISGGSIGSVSTYDIIASGKACYYYDTEYRLLYYDNQIVGGPNSGPDSNCADVNLNAQVYYNSDQQSAFNALGTIVVQ